MPKKESFYGFASIAFGYPNANLLRGYPLHPRYWYKFKSRVVSDGSQTALEPLQSPSTAPSATLAFALVLSLIGVPEHPGVTPGP